MRIVINIAHVAEMNSFLLIDKVYADRGTKNQLLYSSLRNFQCHQQILKVSVSGYTNRINMVVYPLSKAVKFTEFFIFIRNLMSYLHYNSNLSLW